MKATELRINNLVSFYGNRNFPITGIARKTVRHKGLICCVSDLEPIPLTEEWLERFGFEYSDLNGDSGLWKIPPFQIYGKYNQFIYDYKLDVNYVHQLQNLYFALTGQELNQNKEDDSRSD